VAAYAEGAREGGHDVRRVALRDLRFDLVLRGGYHSTKPVEPDVVAQQRLIRWCERLVVATPNWWWSAPALLKGYIDWAFVSGFAARYRARCPFAEPLLRGWSARVPYTQNSPRLVGWLFRRDLFWRRIAGAMLRHCGFRPVRRKVLYGAKDASPARRTAFLASVKELGRRGA
jgi:putative NADPH-quinone reductase